MKTCLYCSADNRDDAPVCFYCGRDLSVSPAQPSRPDGPGSTQPVHPRRPGATPPPRMGDTNPASAYPPPSNTQPYQPQSGYTQPGYPPPGSAPYSGQTQGYPPQTNPAPGYGGQTQAYPSQGSPTNSGYAQNPGYYGQPAGAPGYPTTPPTEPNRPNRTWPILIGGLALVFLCVAGLVVWTLTAAAAGGINRLGQTMSTQAASIFDSPTATVQPTEVAILEPSPWPTFTPAPVLPTNTPELLPTATTAPLPEPTAAPQETQTSATDKLLTPECSAALDHINRMGDQLTSQPTAPLDAAWRTEFTQSVDDLKTFCGSLDSASPVPGHLGEARKNLDLAQSEFDLAKALFNEGVEQLSPGKLLEAGQHVTQAMKYLGTATEELKKIGE